MKRTIPVAVLACATLVLTGCGGRSNSTESSSSASGNCDVGITDTTVKLGSSIPLSGPGAAYGEIAHTAKKYFDSLNAEGGVEMGDGMKRKIELTVLDDAYDPARTVSNARELVDKTGVFSLFSVLGTSPNEAIYDYVNGKGIPNLFMSTGSDVFLAQHDKKPWGMAWLPQYGWEADVFAKYIAKEKPDAKVGILYQNDGYGKGILAGFEKAFKDTDVTIVSKQGYEQSGGSADAQVSKLKASGADVFVDYATGTFVTQSLKKAADLGWKPLTILGSGNNHASLVGPAGADAVTGTISFNWLKDVADDSWGDDAGMKAWQDFADGAKGVDATDGASANGYTMAQLMVETFKKMDGCKRQDLLDAVQSLDGAQADLLLPGVAVSTTDDYPYFIETVQMLEFDGKTWEATGDPVNRP
ncbi:ABC transporter substrate-binding protein [Aeromicrobium sp.]|uniref:ABC transporter substrate-binding protein n=1 Tax=Aeromicrobium sp. TaxID=1871063 RepID=UPI0019A7FB05|nr:ABC transporter substrate-binding protein [Aeromicrobium sp.]MBC7630709.1 ABC transporter substrate-binding protein [Aeromicrobium sp.]